MHSLISGITQSGKTYCAKKLVSHHTRNNRACIVYDPLHDNEWLDFSASPDLIFLTDNQDEFLRAYWNSRNCCAFIDESGDSVGRFNDDMNKTATRGRHWGHKNYYLSQRPAQIAKTVRDQCTELYCFCVSLDDAKVIANEFNSEEIKEAYKLPQKNYFYTTRFDPCRKLVL